MSLKATYRDCRASSLDSHLRFCDSLRHKKTSSKQQPPRGGLAAVELRNEGGVAPPSFLG